MAPAKENGTPTGSGGQKTFVIQPGSTTTITDFGGVGTGISPSAEVIAEVDTLKFEGVGLTAQSMLLTQQGNDLLIAFEGVEDTQVILKNFDLEDLENLRKSTGASVNIGNILFDGQTEIQDSFDIISADQNPKKVLNPNIVTFLNDLNNITQGQNNSNDVINGQEGNNQLKGLSGEDLLRGGDGNDILDGGTGNDTLKGGIGNDTLKGGAGDDTYINPFGIVTEDLNAGTDQVFSAFSYTLPANVENLTFTDDFDYGFIFDGTGNSLNNTIIGNAANNLLKGGAGNDILKGKAGDDTFLGSIGLVGEQDTLISGTGKDTFILGNYTQDFYDDGNLATAGTEDYALITNLNTSQDVIKLSRTKTDYFLASSPDGLPVGTAIYRDKPGGEPDELISIIQGVPGLSLDSNYFKFTSVELELSTLNGNNGFIVSGIDFNDKSGFSVSNAGDVNGDGFDDLIIGAPGAGPKDVVGNSNSAGESYVVFGKAGGFEADFDPSMLNGSNGFIISGINAGDFSGFPVSTAGDINGDGLADLIIGASGADSFAGESYVVLGRAGGFSATISPADLDGSNGFVINGSILSASDAGDVNGDGFDDVLIGGSQYLPSSSSYIGEVYLVFGKAEGFEASLNRDNLEGSSGFVFQSITENDFIGDSVSSAGDINGDGLDDLMIATYDGTSNYGVSYVVFGQAGGFEAGFDLADLNGSNGFVVNNSNEIDSTSDPVSSAGDINGDGFDDLIFGARGAGPKGPYGYDDSAAGKSYVVFGQAGSFEASLDLTELDGSNGFVINGVDIYDASGTSVSTAGDVNGDGFDDLLIGAPLDLISDRPGESYVVFGRVEGFGASFDLAELDGTNGFVINGIDRGDNSGHAVSFAGDVNSDGFDDLIIGAPDATPSNDQGNAGESYVLFGRDFTEQVNRPGTSGDDTLTGTSGEDILIGGLGNDILLGQAGSDVLKGSGGNDILGFDAADKRIEGDAGTDTLRVDGSSVTLDLTATANNKLTGIEVIDLTGTGNNSLTFSRLNLLDLSDMTNQLIVKGNTGDAVSSTGQGWTLDGTITLDDTVYNRYTTGAATLLAGTTLSQMLT